MLRSEPEYRKQVRSAYEKYGPTLEKGVRLSPYSLGVEWFFSPIEFNVWGAIRYLGLPLYPEYPVGFYFLDFADPCRRVGIEVDSLLWHKNKEKDRIRQQEIERKGWKIFRIPSRITFKEREDFENDEGYVDVEKYAEESAEGFLLKIYQSNGWLNDL